MQLIDITKGLRLRRYDGNYDFALSWYQDEEMLRLVDGKDASVYDALKLARMYNYLNEQGELYFIEIQEEDEFKPIGDVTLCKDDLPIVIGESKYRGKGIGKQVIEVLKERARELGYTTLGVREIYNYNNASIRLFENVGFIKDKSTVDGFSYRYDLIMKRGSEEMKCCYLGEEYTEEIVQLMSKYNKLLQYRIGYCSVKPESIRADVKESFADPENKTVGMLQDSKLVAVIGLEIDEAKQVVEMVGPFVEGKEKQMWLELSEQLISFVLKELGNAYTYKFFIHKEHEWCKSLLRSMHTHFMGDEYTLRIYPSNIGALEEEYLVEVPSVEEYEEVKALHDLTWPGVYYSGEEIVAMLDEGHQVFIVKQGKEIVGYTFIEQQLSGKRGYIHFLAVKEAYRGKGIGRALLQYAIKWSMQDAEVEKVCLCVEVENENALKLYYGIGFEIEEAYEAYHIDKS